MSGAGLAVGIGSDYDKLVQGRKIDKIFEPTAGATQAQAVERDLA